MLQKKGDPFVECGSICPNWTKKLSQFNVTERQASQAVASSTCTDNRTPKYCPRSEPATAILDVRERAEKRTLDFILTVTGRKKFNTFI